MAKTIGWTQWFPPELSARRRPGGVVAIYKSSNYFRIFKDSFEELHGGPGFVGGACVGFKFITFYFQKKYQRLGFKLHTKKVQGALELRPVPQDGFQVGIKEVLRDLKYGLMEKTCYFKVKYDTVGQTHFIEFGGPDVVLTKDRRFTPFVPGEKEERLPYVG